jgi:predicted MPP superfamily phosphohydrolase
MSTDSSPQDRRLLKLSKPPTRRYGFDPTRVIFSKRWLAALAVSKAFALFGLWRRPWATLKVLGGLGLLGAAGLGWATQVEPRRPWLRKLTLRLPNLPLELEGLRVGQISDLHLGEGFSAETAHTAVAWMQQERPDLLVLTGDFIDCEDAIADIPDMLRGLSAPLGVYAVPGNHDYDEGIAGVSAALEEVGVDLLLNERRPLRWRDGELWLLGVDDMWEGEADLDEPMADVPAGAFTLLLSHAPDFADEAVRHGIDFQLSGHTHGGHLRLPLFGPFSLPRYGVRYPYGLYRLGSTTLYVTGGIGGMPIRFACPPQATIFTLMRG